MNAIIISDLHIGSRYFLLPEFKRFISSMPDGFELILNGDVIDNPKKKLDPAQQAALDLIETLSNRRRVTWVIGNHDNGCAEARIGHVEFKAIYHIEDRLLIAHGHDFDEIMPKNLTFMKLFKRLHDLRILLGARPVHVAAYAKKWKPFYRVLRENVMKNAALCARENGYAAVTCGHTHFPEDRMFRGIRYINTGSWTECPPFYISVADDRIRLICWDQNRRYA